MRTSLIKKEFKIFAVLLFVLLTGCTKKEEEPVKTPPQASQEAVSSPQEMSRKSVVLTVGKSDTTVEEIYIYMQSQKQEIEALYGEDIWSYVLDTGGTTYSDKLKEQLLDEIIYIKTVCEQAKEQGITLSEDDRMDINEYTADFVSNFTADEMKYYGITEEIVRKIYEENVLANKIYEKLTLNVDTEVPDEEARHVAAEYILLAKYTFDEDGNKMELTKEEQEEVKELADKVYHLALEEESDFMALAKEYSSDEDEIEIIVGRGDMKPELEEAVFALKEGEVSDILENETGYYIFYCRSELDEAATSQAKEEIVLERQNKIFYDNYDKWKAETAVTINESIWEKVNFQEM